MNISENAGSFTHESLLRWKNSAKNQTTFHKEGILWVETSWWERSEGTDQACLISQINTFYSRAEQESIMEYTTHQTLNCRTSDFTYLNKQQESEVIFDTDLMRLTGPGLERSGPQCGVLMLWTIQGLKSSSSLFCHIYVTVPWKFSSHIPALEVLWCSY